jgi:hypothetical protein
MAVRDEPRGARVDVGKPSPSVDQFERAANVARGLFGSLRRNLARKLAYISVSSLRSHARETSDALVTKLTVSGQQRNWRGRVEFLEQCPASSSRSPMGGDPNTRARRTDAPPNPSGCAPRYALSLAVTLLSMKYH